MSEPSIVDTLLYKMAKLNYNMDNDVAQRKAYQYITNLVKYLAQEHPEREKILEIVNEYEELGSKCYK